METPPDSAALITAYDALIDAAVPDLPPQAMAEVFDRLVWCLDDNGASLAEAQRGWMKGGDVRRIEIALCMSEACPFSTAEELREVLDDIAVRRPLLAKLCKHYADNFMPVLNRE